MSNPLAELRNRNVQKQREAAAPSIQIDGQTDRQIDSRLDGQIDGQTSGQPSSQPDARLDGQPDARPDVQTGGQPPAPREKRQSNARRALIEEAKAKAATPMKTSGMKVAVDLDEFLADLQYELKKAGKRVDKQALLGYAIQRYYVHVKAGGAHDEVD